MGPDLWLLACDGVLIGRPIILGDWSGGVHEDAPDSEDNADGASAFGWDGPQVDLCTSRDGCLHLGQVASSLARATVEAPHGLFQSWQSVQDGALEVAGRIAHVSDEVHLVHDRVRRERGSLLRWATVKEVSG